MQCSNDIDARCVVRALVLMNDNLLLGVTIYAGVIVVVFWAAMVLWAYRDMRARSRDFLGRFFVAGLVAALNVPGLLIYLFLRPRETLSEAYERSLEEEALLQEIEEKPSCPACGHRVHSDWQACPFCHTRLKKACVHCENLLELSWNLCPYCAASQTDYRSQDNGQKHNHVERVEYIEQPPHIPDKWLASSDDQYPQYIDE